MFPIPTEFPYPDRYFSFEAVRSEDELWHPPVLGRDLTLYLFLGSLGRLLAFNIQYLLASRISPFQSYLSDFFFEKFFFFQDYTIPYLWIYFPWITFFFSYPLGIFQIQFEYYFPFFFYFSCLLSILFFFFSSFFYINRTKFDYFSVIITLSFFFFAFPIFLFFSFPIFFSSIIIFFFFFTFSMPFFIRFANYVKFSFPNYFSTKSNNVSFLMLPLNANIDKNFKNYLPKSFKNKFYKVNWFCYCISSKEIIIKIKKKGNFKRFTKFPFFNFNLKDKKKWMYRLILNKGYYSFSNLRFKNAVNDIRQIIPLEGPSVYDPNLPYYDLDRVRLSNTYEELEALLEDDIELDHGPDFEQSNDTSILLENYDEWDFFSKTNFNLPKFRNSKVPFLTTFSQDIDTDLRPVISLWLQNEIGRIWVLKNWLRYLNPKHSDKPLSHVLLEETTLFGTPSLSIYFHYYIRIFSFYFSILESFFNFFFPPWIVRTFSNNMKKNEFFEFLLKIQKIENSFFFIPSHFTNIMRILYSIETYFIKNNKNFSFQDKIYYFCTIDSLLIFFKSQIKGGIHSDFFVKCIISQLSRIVGRFNI